MSDRDRVLASTDLVALIGEHVALRQKGREWVGLCPFHDDKTPSLAVVTHKGDGFYKCFACGAAGNSIDFVMEHLRMDFGGALRFLAQRAGITLAPPAARRAGEVDRDSLFQANAEALRHWRGLLTAAKGGRSRNRAAVDAVRIIGERGIDEAMVEQFQLGVATDSWDDLVDMVRSRQLDERAFVGAGLLKRRQRSGDGAAGAHGTHEGHEGDEASDATAGRAIGGCYDAFRNRIIFPIFDEAARPVAFGARKIDPTEEPKYLNSSESAVFSKSRTLYGLHLAKRPIIDAGCAVVTEGYTDVIACHQAGFRNVVATLGTALTVEHARVIRRLCERVVLLFDGDEAGQKAADRAAEIFFAEPVEVQVCVIPDGRDPDELLKLPDGAERFRAALAAAQPVLDFLVDRFMTTYRAAATMSGRQQRLEAFLARLVELGLGRRNAANGEASLRTRFVLQRLGELVGLPVRDLEAALPAARVRSQPRREPAAAPVGSMRSEVDGGEAAHGLVDGSDTPCVPSAVIQAEAHVLGLLMGHAELASHSIDLGEGHRLPVTEALGAASFGHLPHRRIAERLLPFLEACADTGSPPLMQNLLAELAHSELRALASSLYLAARDRAAVTSATTMLQQACDDLDAARRRFGLCDGAPATKSVGSVDGASEILDRLRRRGHDPAAIARRARTARAAEPAT